MQKPVLALDIDDVFCETVKWVLNAYWYEAGFKLEVEDINTFVYRFPNGKLIGDVINKYLQRNDFIRHLPCLVKPQDLSWLKTYFDIIFVTHRPFLCGPATQEWLARRGFTNCLIMCDATKKYIDADILIDDYAANVVQFVKHKPYRLGIVLRKPWSWAGVELDADIVDRVVECKEWPDILSMLQEVINVLSKKKEG